MTGKRLSTLRNLGKLAATTALAMLLAACGGGGGGGGFSSTPTPTPTPTPSPTPTPTPTHNFVNIFSNITEDTEFTVLGLQASAVGTSASSLVSSGFAVRFDAARDAYVIDLPSYEPGTFASRFEDNLFWGGDIFADNGSVIDEPSLTIFKPSPTNPQLQLEHTTFGTFIDSDYYDYDGDGSYPLGAFAFGTATPSAAVPTTGSAVFDAIVHGYTMDTGNLVIGDANLQFDFGAGTLVGEFSPAMSGGPLGTYTFVNTVFGVGSTTFSGQLQLGGAPSLGTFNGLFTGPAAQELMARWTAPYLNPDSSQWSEMFGVWVGKKP